MKLDHEIQGEKIHGYGHENLNIIEKMERKQIKFGSTVRIYRT
jgi:hypothetical protein